MSIYVVSDLHGQYRLFTRLLKKINFSKEDTMYILGDIIDRGPNSIKLLQYIMKRPNIKCIIGNHEYMMWSYYWEYIDGLSGIWLLYNNGGQKTKEEFEKLTEKEKEEIYNYIKNMYLQIEINIKDTTFLLSHSSFLCNEKSIKWIDFKNQLERVLWFSPWRFSEYQSPEYYLRDNRIHIIGHVPVQKVRIDKIDNYSDYTKEEILKKADKLKEIKLPNIINIDGGCAIIPQKKLKKVGIICMDLERYNKKDCFTYITN